MSEPRTLAIIALAGGLGIMARIGLNAAVGAFTGAQGMPWGIFAVNLAGAFAAGLLFGVFGNRLGVPDWLRLGATVGFLSAFTTFSSLTLDTVRLFEARAYAAAALNSFGSLGLGLLLTYAGLALGRTL